MTNFDNDPGRLAAEAEALLALIDAELHADDPDHTLMPSDEELLAMTERAFTRASAIVEAQEAIGDARIDDDTLADVLATWTAELGLVSSTRAAATADEGRLWKVRVTDPDLVTAILGVDAVGPLSLTVSDTPVADGTAVSVTLPLRSTPDPGITLLAVIDYGDGARIRIPLYQVDRGEAAAQMGLAELSGKAILPASIEATHPVLTLSVLAGPA
ncbi:hypothetical protein ACH49M_31595 [Rhodococcus qingshengii]|uniref:hypothetical protein n=5 Tax=Bacteria TaxID=2 RepID=UPI00093792AF|nr:MULTISPECIES: hypothetical protein [Rhodococcus]AZI65657.1 hypothetical protein EHW12_31540 [Rhodococcus sp. NJ-530]MBS2993429.1 hypothetical protein [Rhodococcus erythropolis]OKA09171.1 hypothetical protein BS618_31145 [Rhodococcus erythropolis]BDQ24280.1 hypothetical protein RQN9TF_33995 [Rhodococcus qingshengii]